MQTGTKIGLTIITVTLLSLVPTIYNSFQKHYIEKSAWIWTKGIVHCGVCKSDEKIIQIIVGDSFGDKDNIRFLHILTEPHHKNNSGSFEAIATVDGSTIKSIRIGKHPGCNYDCIGCDTCGWSK